MSEAAPVASKRGSIGSGISNLVEWAGMATVVIMMIHIILEVTFRSVFNAPIPGTLEWVQYYYIIIVSFVGMYVAQKRREHVSVTMITDRLGLRAKVIAILVGNLLTISTLIFFIWFGMQTALHQMEIGEVKGSGSSLVVVWPARFVVPITLTLFLIAAIAQSVRLFRSPREEIEEIEDAQQEAEL